MANMFDPDDWAHVKMLTATEVAALFGVNRKTIHRWRKTNARLHAATVVTPGGVCRFRESEVYALLRESSGQ